MNSLQFLSTIYVCITCVLYICSADNSDICWHNIQLSFSFWGNSSSEKVAPSFLIFWDISAQDYCDAGELSSAVVIEKYTIISWFPI